MENGHPVTHLMKTQLCDSLALRNRSFKIQDLVQVSMTNKSVNDKEKVKIYLFLENVIFAVMMASYKRSSISNNLDMLQTRDIAESALAS